MRTGLRRLLPLLLLAVVAAGCSRLPRPAKVHWSHHDPDIRLDWLLALLEQNYRGGTSCHEMWQKGHATVDCDRIFFELERLAVEFPRHDRVIMANALVHYEAGQKEKAQQFLDELLSRRRVYPESAVLRARIAIEEGNLRFSRSLLERQLALAPDHAGLHELLAATLYLQGDYFGSRAALDSASRMGAPAWRIAFHHGLLAEALGELEDARLHYTECLNRNPNYQPALSRLMALSSTRTTP